jgi:hypothetical protein
VIAFYPIINHIPKSHRLILGKHLEELCIVLLMLIIKANKERGSNRINLQTEISDDLDKLRILVRLSKDLKFISIKQYTLQIKKLNEIGKMVYSWMH